MHHWLKPQNIIKYYFKGSGICNKKIATCGHYCNSKCGHQDICGLKCEVLTEKTVAECGHKIRVKCRVMPTTKECSLPCEKVLRCGHKCTKRCNQIPCEPCLTEKPILAICSHERNVTKVKCSDKIWNYQERCTQQCNQELRCSHVCTRRCGECYGGYLHGLCQEKCDRVLFVSLRYQQQNKNKLNFSLYRTF